MNTRYYNPKKDQLAFKRHLHSLISANSHRPLVILCIGTDRCSGDSLGPIVGYKLMKLDVPAFQVYGCLSTPVHALNLTSVLNHIKSTFNNPLILAIDASLGRRDHIGLITLGEGPLSPGIGVGKSLPQVGDIHITGIVNIKSNAHSVTLQTTRLNTVMEMADCITDVIASVFKAKKLIEYA